MWVSHLTDSIRNTHSLCGRKYKRHEVKRLYIHYAKANLRTILTFCDKCMQHPLAAMHALRTTNLGELHD